MILRQEGPQPRDLENHRDILRFYEITDNGARELSVHSLKSVADVPHEVLVQGPIDREAQHWRAGLCGVCLNGDLVNHVIRQLQQFESEKLNSNRFKVGHSSSNPIKIGIALENNNMSVRWLLVEKISRINIKSKKKITGRSHNIPEHSTLYSSESVMLETVTCILELPDGACVLYSWEPNTVTRYKVIGFRQAVSCLQLQAKEGNDMI